MGKALGLLFAAAYTLVATADPLPVEQFLKRPLYSQPRISPDGKHIAFIVRGEKHNGLAVIDVETKKARPLTNFADADVYEFHWINRHRLALWTGDIRVEYSRTEQYGSFSVNVDGTQLQELGPPAPDGSRVAAGYVARTYISFIARDSNPDSEDLFVEARTPQYRGQDPIVAVWRWNALENKRVDDLGAGPVEGVYQWLLDRRGVLRAATTYKEGRHKVWYRPGAAVQWQLLEDADETKVSFYLRAFDFDNETLYVAAYDGGDKLAIHKYDFAGHRVGGRLARHPDVDLFDLVFSHAQRKLLGVRYDADRSGTVWLDEHMARVQRMVDGALP
ncbi:MAG: hypothetical protein JOZ85_10250, partial [Betaproteobacteria bacterium]|nr:hypothetical protein [Betaproteobacteria bacterium]